MMFRKSDKELQRLQEQLLAEEEEYEEEYEEEPEEEYEDDEWDEDAEEIEDFLTETEEEEEEPLFIRNHANGYGTQVRNYANRYGRGSPKRFDDDDYDDDCDDGEVLYRADYRRAKRKKAIKTFFLVVLAVAELLLIIGIVGWCVSWIL